MLAFCTHFLAMSSTKSEVVSVRVEPKLKAALQLAADREMRSLANMIEVMIVAYCRTNGHPLEGIPPETLAGQKAVRSKS